MSYTKRPIRQKAAFDWIDAVHRHHPRPVGWLFGTSAVDVAGNVVGVICVGRANARESDTLDTAEATRVCVMPGLPCIVDRGGQRHAASVCSMLYAAAWRAARELGYRRMLTYLLRDEPAVTLRALKGMGWKFVRITEGGSWDRPTRPITDKHPTGPKQLWVVEVDANTGGK